MNMHSFLKTQSVHAPKNVYTVLINLRTALLILVALFSLAAHRNAMAAGSRTPEFLLTDPGFATGTKYQVWTNGIGYFQPTTSGDPQIAGLGSPAYSSFLTAAPYLSTGPVINNNANWTVGSSTPPNFSTIPPYYLPHGTTTDYVCVQWDCYFKAPFTGTYVFQTSSDDGSLLYIGQQQVVYNDRVQGAHSEYGPYAPGTFTIAPLSLSAGYHKMTIMYGNSIGTYVMNSSVSSPTTNGGTYSGSFTGIDSSMFLRRMPTPVVSPASAAYVGVSLNTSISVTYPPATFPGGVAPAGTVIYYTRDGTIPTTSSSVYTGPFAVVGSVTINAIVTAPNFDSSTMAQSVYSNIPAPDPVFNPLTGTFTGTRTVTLTSAVPNCFIYYTLDGSTPTLQNYSGVGASPLTLSLSATTTIKALASAYGYALSNTVSASYTKIDSPPSIASCTASGINTQVNVGFNTTANPTLGSPPVIDQTTANVASNYSIDQGVTVISATLDTGASGDFKTVRLVTSPLTAGLIYNLTH